MTLQPHKGRGAAENPKNRFADKSLERDDDAWDDPEEPSPRTKFFESRVRTAVTFNDSPDVGPGATLNPYRGCEHGCIYCYARPTHEYFGFSGGLDFETKILMKPDLPETLRKELSSKRWKPQVIAMSGVTDCYQPAERTFGITRRCLEVLSEFMNPVVVITKNFLVTRDADHLARMAEKNAALVVVSVTTLDPEVSRVMEPRASHPRKRLETVRVLTEAGIPVSVNVAPVIPGLTDHEIPGILSAVRAAGAVSAAFIPVRLPHGNKELFEEWLGRHFPDRRDKVLNRIRQMRGGNLNDSRFGSRMSGEGLFAEQIATLFDVSYRKAGFPGGGPGLSTASFKRPSPPDLFPGF